MEKCGEIRERFLDWGFLRWAQFKFLAGTNGGIFIDVVVFSKLINRQTIMATDGIQGVTGTNLVDFGLFFGS